MRIKNAVISLAVVSSFVLLVVIFTKFAMGEMKDRGECQRSHVSLYLMPIFNGTQFTLIPMWQRACDQWQFPNGK